MANLTQTVSNTLNILGIGPPNVWGTMNWNDLWGAEVDLCKEFEKGFAETLSSSDVYAKELTKVFDQTLSLTTSLDVLREIGVWDYIATRPTTDWADQVTDVSTKVTDPSDTLTTFPVTSTSWTVV
jgi:hypothetical protein